MGADRRKDWEEVAFISDMPSAHALAEMLRGEGVPALVTSDTQLLGEARPCQVLVPASLAHRARFLLAQSEVSEAELNYLATGKLDADQ